jgi:RND family efflux transporter MFP subunit
MRLKSQIVVSIVAIAVCLCLWVFFVPNAGATLAKLGAPGRALAAVLPKKQTEPAVAAAGEGRTPTAGNAAPAGQNRGAGRNGPPIVVTQPVVIGTVNDQLNAIGSGEAIQSVVVTPQTSGIISEIRIISGQQVKKGQILARMNDEEQVIARDQAQVSVKSAEEKLQLYQNIKSAVSRMEVFDAQIVEENAKLSLRNAELNLKRRDIVAPIDGIVGIVAVNVGDNVTTQTSVVSLDDRSQILVDFWVPQQFATALAVGHKVEASSVARQGELYQGTVEAIDNRIDPASRTVRVRAKIANGRDELRAGMSFAVSMRFDGEDFPAVNPLAVQWDSDGSFVWRMREKTVEKVRVRIIQRNPDTVLVQASLAKGEPVVIEGLQRVRAGGEVRLASEFARDGGNGAAAGAAAAAKPVVTQ